MSKKKAAGKTRQQKRTSGKRLGLKVADNEKVNAGSILARQRGTKFIVGSGTSLGRDHTIFALKTGLVKFGKKLDKVTISVVSK